LGDRDVSFDNILLDDGELVDVQVGVTKQDIVTNVTNNKCNTEKNQTQDVTDVENTGINE
jgi:predicted transport protein